MDIKFEEGRPLCPYCNHKMQKRGTRKGKIRCYCLVCRKSVLIDEAGVGESQAKREAPFQKQPPQYTLDETKDAATISTITPIRIKTLEDLIKVCEIDTTIWDIERHVINKWEVGRKHIEEDITYSTSSKGTTVKEGYKTDTGTVFVEPLFQVKVWLRKKVKEIVMRDIKAEIIEEMKNYAPKYQPITYTEKKEGCLLEAAIFDAHLGKHTWWEETGENNDIKIISKLYLQAVQGIIVKAQGYEIDKILFPIGNDFFNVDNKDETTARGTRQQEDTRWKKTFKKGRQLIVRAIDMLSQIAPVKVIVIPGNHDVERSFYLGEAIECWYHDNPNVEVDNGANSRKYFVYGQNLIGFTHGYSEKIPDLRSIMPLEQKEAWAKTKYREWHLGDQHRKLEWFSKGTEEELGIVVRRLRSLTTADQWHHEKGFIGQVRAAEAFIWSKTNGLVCQYNVTL